MIQRFLARVVLMVAMLSVAPAVLAGAYDDLMAAVSNDDTAKVIDLLQRGMDVNSVDTQGSSLLMIAARNGNQRLLEFLLKNRANILIKNKVGDTALHLAAFRGDLPAVTLLLDAGADLNPSAGWTPLHYACFQGNMDVARLLLERGAKIDAQSPSGLTPLMIAARNGHLEVARILLARHPNAGLKDQSGLTAVDFATKANNTAIADLLAGYAKADH